MSSFYTVTQCETAREELIGAYIGVSPKHAVTLESAETTTKLSLKKPTQCTHITAGKEKRKGRSIPLISDRHFQQSKLLQNIHQLSPVVVAWVGAAYHSHEKVQLAELLLSLYFEKFRVRQGTEETIALVVDAAITKATSGIKGVIEISDSQIAAHLGRSRRAYRDNWKSKVDYLIDLLAEIDEAVIDYVCAFLKYKQYGPSIKPKLIRQNALLYTSTI